MVLGAGMIGTALQAVDRPDVLFCASGVTNAEGHIKAACDREEALLRQQIAANADKTVLYVSSYSINDAEDSINSSYLQHKKRMEALVKSMAGHYIILRTSNVVGRSRQSGNLMNFIYQNLIGGKSFDIWTETDRNLIDVEHLALMAGACVKQELLDRTIYLLGPVDTPILEITRLFEAALGLQGNYILVPKGVYYPCDKTLSRRLLNEQGISSAHYVRTLIEKYFL
jgi:dTDP-4-dehydrorhamnose reductase